MEKAIEKLKTEMDQNKDNAYIQCVGEYLIEYVNRNPDKAAAFLTDDKTIAGSLQEMKETARKQAKNGCAVLTDEEGYKAVFKYFGIDSLESAPAVTQAASKSSLDISLDELLG